MIEEKILRSLEEAEHKLWDAYIALKDKRDKYKEYFEETRMAWASLAVIVEEMRKEYRLKKEVK